MEDYGYETVIHKDNFVVIMTKVGLFAMEYPFPYPKPEPSQLPEAYREALLTQKRKNAIRLVD